MSEQEFEALNQEQRDIWEQNAHFWDDRMGDEGNRYHNELVAPAQERLLDLRPADLVLDIACGNGQFARRMAQLGARVVALDFSKGMIERAKSRTSENPDRIEYSVIDATDEGALMALGERRFDAAVCTMALMDMFQHRAADVLSGPSAKARRTIRLLRHASLFPHPADEDDIGARRQGR